MGLGVGVLLKGVAEGGLKGGSRVGSDFLVGPVVAVLGKMAVVVVLVVFGRWGSGYSLVKVFSHWWKL